MDVALLQSLGASVRGTSQNLGLASVYAADPATFTRLVLLKPGVAWVESNDATRADSSQWDSSQWDSTMADGSQWDSSQWDSSQWDGSNWDGSNWDDAGWDGSYWDGSNWDGSNWDGSNWDGSNWDASGWHGSNWDGSNWDGSGWNASGWNASRMTAWGRAQGPLGTDPLLKWQWGLAGANASRAAAAAPSGKVICIVDSGVDHTHPDLASKMWVGPNGTRGYDFVNGDGDPMDDAGHGTHVAGIAAAALGNGLGVAGLSQARIMAMKVLDRNGTGTEFNLALGIDRCAQSGAHVVSMSLGTPENSRAVHRAVIDAFARGIVLVASVGNAGASCDCVRWPAAYPQVIAVGAMLPNGGRAPFSAVSHGVDFVAPGYAILSTLPGDRYGAASGTSQAVPYVSAAAA
ncbi:MAG TPA: S8 family serine peptidase, partial [Candidatus Thermoplasmatota archaeon]|nr:S8 family serine peptidase [Candidatus Thermoplasmatota archaeon]